MSILNIFKRRKNTIDDLLPDSLIPEGKCYRPNMVRERRNDKVREFSNMFVKDHEYTKGEVLEILTDHKIIDNSQKGIAKGEKILATRLPTRDVAMCGEVYNEEYRFDVVTDKYEEVKYRFVHC